MPLGRPMGGLEGSELVQRKIKSSGRESFILREVLCSPHPCNEGPKLLIRRRTVPYPAQRVATERYAIDFGPEGPNLIRALHSAAPRSVAIALTD